MIADVDEDGSGEIDFFEFSIMVKKMTDAADQGEEMIRVFE